MKHFAVLMLALSFSRWGSGASFQNLDFESARLPVIPRGQAGGFVPIAQALPGWNAYIGTSEITAVLHNSVTLGSPAVLIWGPDYPYGIGGRLDGNFTVALQAGTAGSGPSLSLSQTGRVPSDTPWLFFKARVFPTVSVFDVSLNGQVVPLTEFTAYPDYSVFGAEVSSYSGSEVELRFTVYRGLGNGLVLDSIVFSPVPEPGGLGLFAVGVAAAVCWQRWQTRRRGA